MLNSRFPRNEERWIVDARRSRSMACSVATMAVLGLVFTLALLAGCSPHASAITRASDGKPAAAVPASDPVRSDFKFDDSQIDRSQSEYSRYVLG
jgi:hypothetical protein